MQNLGMGTGGQNMWSKVLYLESPTLICLFTTQLLWGYTMMIKDSLLLSVPIVNCLLAKSCPFMSQIWTVWENK